MSSVVVELAFIAIGYAVSSSALVIVNKWAMMEWGFGSLLTLVQFTFSWVVAFLLGKLGIVEVNPLEWKKVRAFAPACLLFYASIACNMMLLGDANVDTFIVLRSLVPLLTTLAEFAYLGTPLPPARAMGALMVIVCGSLGYMWSDEGASLTAYFWGFAYVLTMVVDTIIIKKIVTDVPLTPWGLVFYNNLIASAMFPVFAVFTGEIMLMSTAMTALTDSGALGAVLVSCVFGVSISFFGLNARKKLQATAFSVLGIMCKFLTVFVNLNVWDHHASPIGIFFLLVCISGGIMYQQIMKGAVVTKNNVTEEKPAAYKPVDTAEPVDDSIELGKQEAQSQ